MNKSCVFSTAWLSAGLLFAGPLQVPDANPKQPGVAPPNRYVKGLSQAVAAQGSMPVENPSALTSYYGYDNDGPMLPAPGDIQSPGHNVEASKTEPDKNTYLILPGLRGADAEYNYGMRFLFQGHESGPAGQNGSRQGYITRVNLDADAAHRVTLMATTDKLGNSLPTIDGSTWYPFSQRLLYTSENGSNGGVWQGTPDYPSTVEDLYGVMGQAGYEGIQADPQGRLIIVEDSGGSKGAINSHAKQPNSFVYRFIPYNKSDLTLGGRLQVLQVMSRAHAGPIVFHAGDPDADIKSQDTLDLHTYGNIFATHWITINDTAVAGIRPFDANALAKTAGGTPFKRPENGQFRPGTNFQEFFFDETGDTDAQTEAGAEYGGFGSIMKLTQTVGDSGMLKMLFRGNLNQTAMDNCGFWNDNIVVFVEDRGDTLHTQQNALDSAWAFDVRRDYGNANTPEPVRVLALGRDPSSTIDSGLLSISGNGFQNEGDNEITGWHISDGDPTTGGLLGAKIPTPFENGWRVFFTQQHGDNFTWEIIPTEASSRFSLSVE